MFLIRIFIGSIFAIIGGILLVVIVVPGAWIVIHAMLNTKKGMAPAPSLFFSN